MTMSLLAMSIVTGAGQARTDNNELFPAENPPVGYSGLQYVDSRGCVYARAVERGPDGGKTLWVPLRTLDREPVCGLRPSRESARGKEATQQWQSTKSPPSTAPALDQVVKVTCRSKSGESYSYTALQGDRIRCANADRMAENNLIVAAADLEGGEKPIYELPKLPSGFRYAFGEERHNPNRGERSQAGTAAMNQIWTRSVPQRLVHPEAENYGLTAEGYRSTKTPAPTYRASSKSEPSKIHRNLQVGAFREEANAAKAAGRMQARGIPARIVAVQSDGRQLQVVLAGPFESEAQTRSALAAAQAAGYTNAYMRR